MIFIRMASQLGFSEFNKDQKPNMELLSNMYKKRKNKTIRKRAKLPSAKAEEFLNSMKNYSENMEEMDGDGEGLANFNPPPKAELTKIPEDVVENLDNQNSLNQPADDSAVTVEGYNNLNNDVMKNYYDSYVPYYNNPQKQNSKKK